MTPLSGQTTVASAGTAVPLADFALNAPLMVRALPGNSGAVALGNDGSGDVSTSSGLLLSAGEAVVFEFTGHLSSLLLDAENDGDGAAWLVLSA